LSGALEFGNVQVGQKVSSALEISNTGNSMLTVSGFSSTGGTADVFTADFVRGAIAAGATQRVTIVFAPVEARSYSGTLRVDADHTSGTNTINLSGTGMAVPKPTFAATGFVRDASGAGMSGVRVETTSGPTVGRSTTTQSSGYFALPSLEQGTYTFQASKTGYTTSTVRVDVNQNTTFEISLSTSGTSGRVQRPTARCKDGTYSYSQNRRGTCSGHGGVDVWLCENPPCYSIAASQSMADQQRRYWFAVQ
jgi:hypothetical protein